MVTWKCLKGDGHGLTEAVSLHLSGWTDEPAINFMIAGVRAGIRTNGIQGTVSDCIQIAGKRTFPLTGFKLRIPRKKHPPVVINHKN
jgi:hypothetical protein